MISSGRQRRSRSTRVAQEVFRGETWSELIRICWLGYMERNKVILRRMQEHVFPRKPQKRSAFLEHRVVPVENRQEVHLGNPVSLPEFTSLSNYIWPKLILTWVFAVVRPGRRFQKLTKEKSCSKQNKKFPSTSFCEPLRVDRNPLFPHSNTHRM